MQDLKARDYRKIAADTCAPFSGTLALITLVYGVVASALGGTGIGFLFEGALLFGYIAVIKTVFANQKPEIGGLFSRFENFIQTFVLELVKGLFIFFWSLLLFIPGIIKGYSYSMAEFIKDDNPELSATECITKSRELMNGHKWELFCLEFSYIGWLLLCVLTFGILTLWVQPKMLAAQYAFYKNISGQL